VADYLALVCAPDLVLHVGCCVPVEALPCRQVAAGRAFIADGLYLYGASQYCFKRWPKGWGFMMFWCQFDSYQSVTVHTTWLRH
jgi:hypothetical protein